MSYNVRITRKVMVDGEIRDHELAFGSGNSKSTNDFRSQNCTDMGRYFEQYPQCFTNAKGEQLQAGAVYTEGFLTFGPGDMFQMHIQKIGSAAPKARQELVPDADGNMVWQAVATPVATAAPTGNGRIPS